MPTLELTPFNQVLDRYSRGEMVIMVDDADRENEGDLVVATEAASTEQVAMMMREGRGLLCVSIPAEIAERLKLPLQTLANNSLFHTAFTISVDHKSAEGYGATASQRLRCMQAMLKDDAKAEDFVIPGHVYPLIANQAGTLGRIGQTEGSADLARLAGFKASSLLCEILAPDGTMARGATLIGFAKRHDLAVTSVAEVKRFRLEKEVHVRLIDQFQYDTRWGMSQAFVFCDDAESKEHLALQFGTWSQSKPPLVRVHSECLTGDVFGSRRCDCGPQLAQSLDLLESEGSGLLIYLRQEGRGIGLSNKLRAYELQDSGLDTVEANVVLGFQADQRSYLVAARILKYFGLEKIRLITNNPRKIAGLEEFGIAVSERCGVRVEPDEFNRKYLAVKRDKLGHLLQGG